METLPYDYNYMTPPSPHEDNDEPFCQDCGKCTKVDHEVFTEDAELILGVCALKKELITNESNDVCRFFE